MSISVSMIFSGGGERECDILVAGVEDQQTHAFFAETRQNPDIPVSCIRRKIAQRMEIPLQKAVYNLRTGLPPVFHRGFDLRNFQFTRHDQNFRAVFIRLQFVDRTDTPEDQSIVQVFLHLLDLFRKSLRFRRRFLIVAAAEAVGDAKHPDYRFEHARVVLPGELQMTVQCRQMTPDRGAR